MVTDLHAIFAQSHFPDVPLVFAVCTGDGNVNAIAAGTWSNSQKVRLSDRFYAASLAKQLTGAAAAVLVQQGKLELNLPVSSYLRDLPDWSAHITPRHLIYHTAGLPSAGEIEPVERDWTDEFAYAALRRLPHLAFVPGSAFRYSNLGYLLLAHIIAKLAECDFSSFIDMQLLKPLGLNGIGFVQDDINDFPQLAWLGASRPLTNGDGGLWSTVEAFSLWQHHQNIDTLGIERFVTVPMTLAGGDVVQYGWGLGLRQHHGQPMFIHGGQWKDCVAKAVRIPSIGISVSAMSAGASMEQLSALLEALIEG